MTPSAPTALRLGAEAIVAHAGTDYPVTVSWSQTSRRPGVADPVLALAVDPNSPDAENLARTADPVVIADDLTLNSAFSQGVATAFLGALSLLMAVLAALGLYVRVRAGTVDAWVVIVCLAGLVWAGVFGAAVVVGLMTRRHRKLGYVAIGSTGLLSNHFDVRTRRTQQVSVGWDQVAHVGTALRSYIVPVQAWWLPIPRRFKSLTVTRIQIAPTALGIDDALLTPGGGDGVFTHSIGLLHKGYVDERVGTPAMRLANIALKRFAGERYVEPKVINVGPLGGRHDVSDIASTWPEAT